MQTAVKQQKAYLNISIARRWRGETIGLWKESLYFSGVYTSVNQWMFIILLIDTVLGSGKYKTVLILMKFVGSLSRKEE
jgi:hypothetical protein